MSEFSGLQYLPAVISPEREHHLLQLIEAVSPAHWSPVAASGAGRKVLQFGFRYDYRRRRAILPNTGDEAVLPMIPELTELSALIPPPLPTDAPSSARQTWNQCIINKYRPGEGITWHTDASAFGERIACFTVGSPSPMQFRQGGYIETFTPQARSVYVMSADARHLAQHRMPNKKTDGVRYSITFRHVPQ